MTTPADSGLPARLRQERERVGLSQDALAKKAGVSRVTQGNYESGKRSPDAVYLSGLGEFGMDMHFVAFGERATPGAVYELGVLNVLPLISKRAGTDSAALWEVLNLAAENEASAWAGRPEVERVAEGTFDELVSALFDKGGRLLGHIVSAVRDQTSELKISLPPRHRAELLLSLYRSFHAHGKVDSASLKASVSLVCKLSGTPLPDMRVAQRTRALAKEAQTMDKHRAARTQRKKT